MISSDVIDHTWYPIPDAGSLPDDPMMHRFARATPSFRDMSDLYSVSKIALTCVIPEPLIFQSVMFFTMPSGVISYRRVLLFSRPAMKKPTAAPDCRACNAIREKKFAISFIVGLFLSCNSLILICAFAVWIALRHIEAAPAIVNIMSLLKKCIFSDFPATYATPWSPPYVAFLSAAKTIPSFVTIPNVVVPVFNTCFLDSSFIVKR